MANYRTTTDLLQAALWNAGEAQNNSSEYYSTAMSYINRVYQDICSGGSMLDPEIDEEWWWLRNATPNALTLLPSVNIPKVDVVQGDPNVTWDVVPVHPVLGTPIDLTGWMFQVQGDNGDVYRIASHVPGAQTATLDLGYTYQSGLAKPMRVMCYQYAIPANVKRVVGQIRAFQFGRNKIDYADITPMRQRFPLNQLPTGIPIMFAMPQEGTLEFSHYVGDLSTLAARVEYDFLVVPPDLVDDNTSAPLMPFQYRSMLSDFTAALVLADKDDGKYPAMLAAAKARLKSMSMEHRRRAVWASELTGKIQPRQTDIRRSEGPLRTESGFILG